MKRASDPHNTQDQPRRKRLRHQILSDLDTDPNQGMSGSDDDDSDFVVDDLTSEEPEMDSHQMDYLEYCKKLPLLERTRLQALERTLTADSIITQQRQPLKYRILTSQAPTHIKSQMLAKLENLGRSGDNENYELSCLHTWLRFPWGQLRQLPISADASTQVTQDFLTKAMATLDTVSYGQTEAKSKIMFELSHYIQKPDKKGFILGLKGPPGTGKTTLVAKGLATVLDRPFYRVDLGGAKHGDCLIGTRKVFERSDMGDLARILLEAQCLNPIIFFDELDKVSQSEYGTELMHVLNDLTDVSRNHAIVDQYLGLPMDLSRAIFVFAYNTSEPIVETLRDRIHEIELCEYSLVDKMRIARDFFIPQACHEICDKLSKIVFEDKALEFMIKHQTKHEAGVRELKRQIDELYLKLNWVRLTGGQLSCCGLLEDLPKSAIQLAEGPTSGSQSGRKKPLTINTTMLQLFLGKK